MDEALVILTKSPFGRIFSVEGIRMASGLAAMDIKTTFLMIGESIYTLHRGQDGTGIHFPTHEAGLDILEMSEVEIVIVREEMERLGVREGDLMDYPFLKIINREEMVRMVAEAECSFRF
ncbi:MAG: DsrE family protein [Promethearchaeota archaeon]